MEKEMLTLSDIKRLRELEGKAKKGNRTHEGDYDCAIAYHSSALLDTIERMNEALKAVKQSNHYDVLKGDEGIEYFKVLISTENDELVESAMLKE